MFKCTVWITFHATTTLWYCLPSVNYRSTFHWHFKPYSLRYEHCVKIINSFPLNHYECNFSTYSLRSTEHYSSYFHRHKWKIWLIRTFKYVFYWFFSVPENVEEKSKRQKIEAALADPNTTLSKWQEFAKTEYGLVNGK